MHIYRVYIIEYGKVTHHWSYTCRSDAIRQLNFLLQVYEDVSDVLPVLITSVRGTETYKLKDLLNILLI